MLSSNLNRVTHTVFWASLEDHFLGSIASKVVIASFPFEQALKRDGHQDRVCVTNVKNSKPWSLLVGCFIGGNQSRVNDVDVQWDQLQQSSLLYHRDVTKQFADPLECGVDPTYIKQQSWLGRLSCGFLNAWCFFRNLGQPCLSAVACFGAGQLPVFGYRNTWEPLEWLDGPKNLKDANYGFRSFTVVRPGQLPQANTFGESNEIYAPAASAMTLNLATVVPIPGYFCGSWSEQAGVLHAVELPWGGGYHPLICCATNTCSLGEAGKSACDVFLHSIPSLSASTVHSLLPAAKAARKTSLASQLKVDVFIRTFSRDEQVLMMLLHSLDIHWPTTLWQSTVHVVLDQESRKDRQLCASLNSNKFQGNLAPRSIRSPNLHQDRAGEDDRVLKCHLESIPQFIGRCRGAWNLFRDERRVHAGSGNYSKVGATAAMWSLLNADAYVDDSVDFIVLSDADVVFWTPLVPELIFDWAKSDPRPVMHGHWKVPLFIFSIISLGMDWIAEFMDSMPVVVKYGHLKEVREFISARMLGNTSTGMQRGSGPSESNHFSSNLAEHGFCEFLIQVGFDSQSRGWFHNYKGEFLSVHTLIVHYLWHNRIDDYFWSVQDAAVLLRPGQNDEAHACPSLKPALHICGAGPNTRMLDLGHAALHGSANLLSKFHFLIEDDLFRKNIGLYVEKETLDDSSHCMYRNPKSLIDDFATLTSLFADGQL